jgi:isoleucyl-tRNA synthetase
MLNKTEEDTEGGKYKDTVDLPKTSFGMRANSVVREPEIQRMWEDNKVLEKLLERNNEVRFLHVKHVVYCLSFT